MIGSWILSFMLLPLVWANDVSVTATVDRNQMRLGDTFTYSIAVTSVGSVSFDEPRLPDLNGFEILSSWSGSEMRGSFVNGQIQTQRSQTFNYQMAATQEGSFTIGAAEVVVNGQALRTNPITIQVGGGAAQAPPPRQRQQAQPGFPGGIDPDALEEDLFSQLLRRRLNPARPTMPSNPEDIFFIHVDVDKKKVYQGEQVTVAWYLVTRGQIADIDTLKYPTLSGFWKEDIEVATRLNFQPEIINGVPYQKALLASYALFPIKPGTSTIDTYQAKCRVIGVGGFGQPFDRQITKQSPDVQIEVLPLPDTGKPSSFTGGVGDFTLSAQTDTNSVKANTPVTLKVRIEGRGNAKSIDFPQVTWPEGVTTYDTKSEMKFFPNGRSYKEFETLLVPRTAGDLTLPALAFAFFDPVKKSYYEQSTNEIKIKVEPGEGGSLIPSEQMSGVKAPTTKTEIKKVLPGVLLTSEEPAGLSLAQQLGAWGMLYALTFAGLGLFAYRQVGQKEQKENIRRQIDRRMKVIDGFLDKGEWRQAAIEANNLIASILGEIAGLGGASFEFDKLVEKSPPSFKREVAPHLKIVLAKLEVVGFAPEGVVGTLKDKKELKKLISEAEKWLLKSAQYDFSDLEKGSKS